MYLIAGYLGYGNFGDELLARIAEQQIKKRDKFAEFAKLSSKNNFFEHFKQISACHELVCLGGLFQDKSSVRSVLYYFLLVLLAKVYGKRIRIMAQGIGPLTTWIAKLLAQLAFKMADVVSVRDKTSSMILKDWGVDHYFGSDLSWLLSADTRRISAEAKERIDNYFAGIDRKLITISLRSNKNQNDDGLINKILDLFPYNYKETPVLILQMQDKDYKIHTRFNQLDAARRGQQNYFFIDANQYTAEELVYILENYSYHIIGMRLHALILARIADLEITPIAFDPKIKEFRDQVDLYSLDKLKERAEKHFI